MHKPITTGHGTRIGDAFWIEWKLCEPVTDPGQDRFAILQIRHRTCCGKILVKMLIDRNDADDLKRFAAGMIEGLQELEAGE